MGCKNRVEEETSVSPSSSLSEALLFATMYIIGLPVDVHVKDGSVYSGMFYTACVEKDYGIVLKRAKMIKRGKSNANIANGSVVETLVILSGDLVQVVAKGVSLPSDGIAHNVMGDNVESIAGVVCTSKDPVGETKKSTKGGMDQKRINQRRSLIHNENGYAHAFSPAKAEKEHERRKVPQNPVGNAVEVEQGKIDRKNGPKKGEAFDFFFNERQAGEDNSKELQNGYEVKLDFHQEADVQIMYPSSSSSSSQKSTFASGLIRYGSAPGSLLNSAVDSVIGANYEFPTIGSTPPPSFVGHYFSGDSSSLASESTCKVSSSTGPKEPSKGVLHRSFGFNEIPQSSSGGGSSSLVRQKSSPAGFFSHLSAENGFSVTSGTETYSSRGCSNGGCGASRLKSQLSFTRQDSLSQISEVNESVIDGLAPNNRRHNTTHSYSTAGFAIDSWDDTNSIAFSTQPSKRAKNIDGDIFNCLNTLETQLSPPHTSLEMATVEKLLHIPEDSVPCKIRAKRGCATHPRSIAERERRTRISGKLKKLQELVPNMDKQTSYADMLDLAVQHIKGLQNQVQKLHKELENCTCGCKQST